MGTTSGTPGHRGSRGHPLPGQCAGVEPPDLARPLGPLDRHDDGVGSAGEHGGGDHLSRHVGHGHPLTGCRVDELNLAASAGVPDGEQEGAGVVGVERLELGVVARGECHRRAAPSVRADRQRDQLAPLAPGLRDEVGDEGALAGRRGGTDQRDLGGAGDVLGQQRMLGVGEPVDDDAELLAAGTVAEDQQPLLDGEVEHLDQLAEREREEFAGRRVGEVGLRGVRSGDGDDDAVAAARPRTELGVLGVAAREQPGVAAVGPHHPHLGAHASAGGDEAGEPAVVGRPGDLDDGIGRQGDRHRGVVGGVEALHPHLGRAAAVGDEGDP